MLTDEQIDELCAEPSTEPPAESPLLCCEDIALPEGAFSMVYIGPGGIFALAQNTTDPKCLYQALRNLLGTAKIRMYVQDSGLYDPITGLDGQIMDEAALETAVHTWTMPETATWRRSQMETFAMKLVHATAVCRGSYTDEEGNVFILRNGTLRPASALSADVMYYLTLFGGTLGFHRFFIGKYFSGIVYLLTGGLFGIGWLFDLLRVMTGAQKDGKKCYFYPLKQWPRKLLLLPFGILFSVLAITFQISILTVALNALTVTDTEQAPLLDDATSSELQNALQNMIDKLTDYFGE